MTLYNMDGKQRMWKKPEGSEELETPEVVEEPEEPEEPVELEIPFHSNSLSNLQLDLREGLQTWTVELQESFPVVVELQCQHIRGKSVVLRN